MSTITARIITRPIIATVIAGAFLGAVATPYFAAAASSGVATVTSHSVAGSDDNSPWPK